MTSMQAPSHVPPALVRDFNYTDMRGEHDVYEHFRKLHNEPDIFWTPHCGGHWVVSRYEDMEYILTHPEDFSSRHQSLPKNPVVLPLLEYDDELHAEFRRVLAPFFTPRKIGDLEQVSRDLTNALMDEFQANGECEFVSQFSKKMPIMILMSLLALPSEDTPYLLQISEDIVRSGDPEVQGPAFERVAAYIGQRVIPARRANPGDDIFTAICEARVDGGRPMTDAEIIGFGTVLIAAGLDTVASMLGFITKYLATHDEHRRFLAQNPDQIRDALEELLRRYNIANISRMVRRDMEYKGVQFKEGDCVLVPTSCAGIDPRRFDDPFTVDLERKDRKNLVFGRGPHQCIGAFLARTELRVFLREWLRRIPEFRLKPGDIPVEVPGKANGMRHLALEWDV